MGDNNNKEATDDNNLGEEWEEGRGNGDARQVRNTRNINDNEQDKNNNESQRRERSAHF